MFLLLLYRTPRYRFTNLSTSVRVKVQLERPTDKDTSEPLDFTYLPDSECSSVTVITMHVK